MSNMYYACPFIDSNGNGQYDSGSLTEGVQPEEVYYFPKKTASEAALIWCRTERV